MFGWTDQQAAEGFMWLVLFVIIVGAGALGCVLHGLHREYRQYLRWRATHAAWKMIVEGEDK
jgi:hypothetical protein